ATWWSERPAGHGRRRPARDGPRAGTPADDDRRRSGARPRAAFFFARAVAPARGTTEVADGVDLPGGGGAVRSGVGAGPALHRGLDPAVAERGHAGGHGRELLVPLAGAEVDPDRD